VAKGGPRAGRRDEQRLVGAWRAWLSSLATDADAASAAAYLYAELADEARDAWLRALAEDLPALGVEPAAVYAPLLAVESDPGRLERICQGAGSALKPTAEVRRALVGTDPDGGSVLVLVIPLYLDFVWALVCRLVPDEGLSWVRQVPIVRDADAPQPGQVLEGAGLCAQSPEAMVDLLAHAVVAHKRRGKPIPQLLCQCADLFSSPRPSLQQDAAPPSS